MSEEELHRDVFNPKESDLEYFRRRQRELAPVSGSTLFMSNIGRIADKGSGARLNNKQYAAFIADRKRLEWLIANSAFVSHSRDGEVCNVWFSHDPDDDGGGAVPVGGYPQKCYHDAREAIDAAMRKSKSNNQAEP